MSTRSPIFSQHTLGEVATRLTDDDKSLLGVCHLPNADNDAQRAGAFLDNLFARAPHEVVRRKSSDELYQILHGSLKAVSLVDSSPDRVVCLVEHTDSWTGLFLALDDHPFIISSVAERLYDEDIALECFQHPILAVGKQNIALSYIEISPRSREGIDRMILPLRETLTNLKRVVGDHELMLSHTTKLEGRITSHFRTEWGELPGREIAQFLGWITTGTFFFCAVSNWTDASCMDWGTGLWGESGPYQDALRGELIKDYQAASASGSTFSIHKLQRNSIVHRGAPLVHIIVRPDSNSNGWFSIVGYLTSKAWASEAEDIPVLRHKLRQLLSDEKTPANSHDYKYVVEVIDNMPTDEALRMPISDLRNIAHLALGSFSREDSRSLTCIDAQHRWALTTLIIPPERYSAEMSAEVRAKIESYLGAPAGSSELHLDSSKKRQLRMYVSTPITPERKGQTDLDTLARILQRKTLSWSEELHEQLALTNKSLLDTEIEFSESYRASISIPEACDDYSIAVRLSTQTPLNVSFFFNSGFGKPPVVSCASLGSPVSLSTAVPVFENVGLEVLGANSYDITRNGELIHILKCAVQPYDKEPLTLSTCNEALAPALVRILSGSAVDDPLNLLLRKIPITINQVSLLRCYCAFLWQTHKIATKRTMWKALAYSPEVALQLVRLFTTLFDPSLELAPNERVRRCAQVEHDLQVALRKVPDITYDRILRALVALVKNTVRTNFYTGTETLALKVRSQQVEFMPHPRPLFEIFVFSSRIEGTHLRSARVARGGIRWSERLDDYRTEVLGLMKTQKVKNVIIVPSGAKGGFVIKQQPATPEALPAAVTAGYREYIAALLSLADNMVAGTVTHPKGLVVHDDPDPYFVVAADKGTATFSDIANSIAENDFSFWLGDAFASGGSAGYDHKKYGITARGGWECVKRHARDVGVDTNSSFTAVGIGDMSGDVFGNAMILTPNLLLVAAFNHKHIFIDPTPNAEAAFAERERLFKLPRSQWSDFSSSIISRGGGVFNRFDKEISLTPEIRKALAIPDSTPDVLDGETLISFILKSPVALLWNGGIGTYVKARSESNSDVNDGANDAVRINADELRCQIVGEGGNLGFSQKARIEAAQLGIRINTDAIDNSGGVDLSDHEVNLKLLFSPLLMSGSLSRLDRNSLLLEISGEVVESVLQHNRDQSFLLSMESLSSTRTLEQYRALIREMHNQGFLDRNRDILPDEQELDMRAVGHRGMLRPELAQCSAAVKMWIKEGLRTSPLLDEENLSRFLLSYFPSRVRQDFKDAVLSHPLRRDIISNEIVGSMTLAVGIPFIPSMVTTRGVSVESVMKSLLAADSILDAEALRTRIRGLDTTGNFAALSSLWADVASTLRKACDWLLQSHGHNSSLQDLLSLYAESFARLRNHGHMLFSGTELSRFQKRVEEYLQLGVHKQDAITLSLYRRIYVALEVLWCAREYKQDVTQVAQILSNLFDSLSLSPIFALESSFQSSNKWEQELAAGSFQEIRRGLSCIAGTLLSRPSRSESDVATSLASCRHFSLIQSVMNEVQDGARSKRPVSLSVLPLISRHIRALSVELGTPDSHAKNR
jgi:glutamate dehydrogenase